MKDSGNKQQTARPVSLSAKAKVSPAVPAVTARATATVASASVPLDVRITPSSVAVSSQHTYGLNDQAD